MNNELSRRDFLRTTGKGLLGVAAVSMIPAAMATAESTEVAAPAWPWKWEALDVEEVKKATYAAFYTHGGCCAATVAGILETMANKYGYPYNQLNARMFANGAGGYGAQTLCGSLGGACAVIGCFCEGSDAGKIRNELYAWYKAAAFPIYQPEISSITTVADSIQCSDSVGIYMKATGYTMADDGRKARCAGLSADVAAKTIELLNVHFGLAEAAPVEEAPAVETAANEYIGESTNGFGGKVQVKVTMDGDKIANIEVLSHNESAGISDPAFANVIPAIIANNTTEVDVATGATLTSKALMEAVNDALSKVGK